MNMTSNVSPELNDILTSESTERANFGDRFFASFVDNIIVRIPLRIVFIFLFSLWSNPYFSLFFGVCVELVATLLYFAVFAYRKNGQTWGKKWNNVKVTDMQGNDLILAHFIVREFVARGIPIILSIFFGMYANLWVLTYLLALSKDRRALHDVIAGTQVVKLK
jgi:uncharacterized RDD family membrane protein YckC